MNYIIPVTIRQTGVLNFSIPIQESKRAFFYSIVTEGGDKEKLEAFVNFCEDAIFEMQHANALMASDEEGGHSQARQAAYKLPTDEEEQYGQTLPYFENRYC